MSRSLKKGPYIDQKLLQRVKSLKSGDKTVIKTWARASVITPEMVGFVFGVHNGKIHVPVLVVENMVGHRLGEFSLTRKFVRHGGRMQREIEAKQAETEVAQTKPDEKEKPA
ncbi:MAG: 30S ribosomal protein S19 [Patescibacteria group bacterium]